MYQVTINDFEGPLDLLLHLIKKHDMDIMDVSIEEITKQYLDFITRMEEMNLNIASEYLVMASELIEIKSSTLLPKPEIEEEEEDKKEILINRLIEYQKYKEVTSQFKELELERQNYFTKPEENLNLYGDTTENLDLGEIDLQALLDAFSKFLVRKEEEKPLNTKISKREYSVKQRSGEIINVLKKKKKMYFEELFENNRKDFIIVTFLSILNLVRHQEVSVVQTNNFDRIMISLRGEK